MAREIPPPLELDCLRALWEKGPANARGVREAIAPSRMLAYTTVLTLLERLHKRGLVERRKSGRSFVYAPVRDRESMRIVAVEELVQLYFGGSRGELTIWLQGAPAILVEEAATSLDATLL